MKLLTRFRLWRTARWTNRALAGLEDYLGVGRVLAVYTTQLRASTLLVGYMARPTDLILMPLFRGLKTDGHLRSLQSQCWPDKITRIYVVGATDAQLLAIALKAANYGHPMVVRVLETEEL